MQKTLGKTLLEIKPGVFVGSPNERIREYLWGEVNVPCIMAYDSPDAMKFTVKTKGKVKRKIENISGLYAVQIRKFFDK